MINILVVLSFCAFMFMFVYVLSVLSKAECVCVRSINSGNSRWVGLAGWLSVLSCLVGRAIFFKIYFISFSHPSHKSWMPLLCIENTVYKKIYCQRLRTFSWLNCRLIFSVQSSLWLRWKTPKTLELLQYYLRNTAHKLILEETSTYKNTTAKICWENIKCPFRTFAS